MTENEAKEKWCPMFRVSAGSELGEENVDNRECGNRSNCIGSRCMAWRWRREPAKPGAWDDGQPGDGYCGLAEP